MEEEIDIKELIVTLWRKKWVILIVTMVFGIFGLIKYHQSASFSYKDTHINNENKQVIAEIDFIINDEIKTNIASGDFILADGTSRTINSQIKSESMLILTDELVETFKNIATSKTILNETINELKLEETDSVELASNIVFIKKEPSQLLKLAVRYDNEKDAIQIVETLFSKFKEKISDIYSISDVKIVNNASILSEKEIEILNQDLSEYQESLNAETNNTNDMSKKVFSKKKVLLISIVGFVLACGTVVVLEMFNNSVKNDDDLEKNTNLKTLVKIPKNNVERFKLLRVNINECQTILITSAEKEDGKTFVAENLAKSFSELGKKVILIDLTKNENPMLKKYNGKGLSDYLNSQDKFVEKYAAESTINNLSILPVGTQKDKLTELLESDKMRETINTLERLYDVIIIDSESILDSSSTLAIAKISRYTILVSSERKTKLNNIIKAKNNIEDIGGNVIGNVLNRTEK